MSQCGAIGCNHNNSRETCKFYRLPQNPKESARWLRLLKRDPKTLPKVLRVCSCHFRDEHHLTPEKRSRKRKAEASTQQQRTKKIIEFDDSQDQASTSSYLTEHLERNKENVEHSVKRRDASTNTETSKSSLLLSPTVLAAENYFLKQKIEELQRPLREKWNYENIKDNTKLFNMYTGLPDSKIFEVLFNFLDHLEIEYYFKRQVRKISKKDQLLLTLMKLRHNYLHEDLAHRFDVSSSTVSNITITWVHLIAEVLYNQLMGTIPSRHKNKSCLPTSFSNFTNCRIILDCTEVYTVVPRSSMKNQKSTYSTYKHRNTLKALVGVAPNGAITFLSDLFPGSVSDKVIVQKSGIIDQLEPGDLVLADKGFLIRDILPPEVHLNVPPFLVTSQFTKEQIQMTESIARARIHVERAIRRLKCYRILNLVPSTLRRHIDVILKAVGALTNLHYPLIKEVEPLMME